MPRITEANYPPRLDRFIRSASAEIGKRFVVRTNPFLTMLGLKVYSRPGAISRKDVLPINLSPVIRYVDDKGNITPLAEYLIASTVAIYLASHLGYRGTNIAGFGVDAQKASGFLNETAIKLLQKEWLPSYHNLTLGFALDIAAKNILAANGYDPIDEDAERRFAQTLKEDIDTFSDCSVLNNLRSWGAETAFPSPAIVRILTYNEVLMLAGVYMYLPQSLRDVMLKKIGSFLEEHMLKFLNGIGFGPQIEARTLLANGFRKYYTPSLHRETIDKAFDHLVGEEGILFPRSADKMNKEDVERGSIAMEGGHYYEAYEYFDAVGSTDVSAQIEAAKRGLIRDKSKEYPEANPLEINRMILREMVVRGMIPAALAFQEDAFGADTDLGERAW